MADQAFFAKKKAREEAEKEAAAAQKKAENEAEAAKKLDFEEAANLRDRVKQLRQKMTGSY